MASEAENDEVTRNPAASSNLRVKISPPQRLGIAPQIPNMSLADLDSLIEPLTRPRNDYFSEFEIQLMLEEIGKLRHIILAKEQKNGRVLKKAWEDVARNMAQRFPTEYKRTANQIKRKWKQILAKTGKKIRESQGKQEVELDGITSIVARFLASTNQHEQLVQKIEAQESNEGASPFSIQRPDRLESINNGNVSTLTEDNAQIRQFEVIGVHPSNSAVATERHLRNNSSDDDNTDDDSSNDVVMISHTLPDRQTSNDDTFSGTHLHSVRKGRTLHNELIRQSRAEHALRMEILQMKRRYWQIKIEALFTFGMSNVFSDEFPPELHGRVAPEEFQETISKVNNQLRRSMSINLKWLLCGFICCCCTLGCSMWPAICVNRKVKRNIEKTLEIENARLYCQLGLNWSLTKQRTTEPVVLMEYVLRLDFIPKLSVYQPD
ncbi:unnamed protein product [Hymenolepis diminuta]|uniref:Myb_DNA-bind_5 domain-containing protein n=1 Tax=Hymenolepis diminuta TaxID=6216 RepID=A0A0R3SHY9_HYMDI|nr:unnamed protein product [Hymenolepis diminuta]